MSNSITFVHCADIHMDAPFSNMGENGLSGHRREELKKTLEGIITLILEQNADYLLISGDLYEHNYSTRASIQWMNEQFARLGDKPVIIIPGNHDPNVRNSWYQSFPWHANVHILTSQNPDYIDIRHQAYFYGIGFDSFHQEKPPVQKSPEIFPDRINVCLFHGTLDMTFTQNSHNPMSSGDLAAMGFDYYALGHFHGRSEDLSALGMLNPGSPEPLGFDEQGEHGVYLVTITKERGYAERDYTFIPVQQRRYYSIPCDITDLETESALYDRLVTSMRHLDADKNMVSIHLTGCLSPHISLDIPALEQKLNEECYFIRVADDTRPGCNLEELALEPDITGVFVRLMLEKLEKAQGEEKNILEKALNFGLEAISTGVIRL